MRELVEEVVPVPEEVCVGVRVAESDELPDTLTEAVQVVGAVLE